jgi:hypothetical protein
VSKPLDDLGGFCCWCVILEGFAMACPICFFTEANQRKLKNDSDSDRFESRLLNYKNNFISDVQKLEKLSTCNCYNTYNDQGIVNWTDLFLYALTSSIDEINNAFQTIIDIYEKYVSQNPKIATDSLWRYLESKNLLTDHYQFERRLLFRARVKVKDDNSDTWEAKDYFHIPFSKRHLVKEQRFSVNGQPMLYFGSSVLNLTKELNSIIDNLAVAAFIPPQKLKIFDLRNSISEVIEKILPAIFDENCNIPYDDERCSISRHTIVKDIHRTILAHVSTLHVDSTEKSFIAEYIIPQMLTTALLENGYSGIVYPSTKDYSDILGHHKFSSHHINFAIFAPYDRENDININFFNSFIIATLDQKNRQNFQIEDIETSVKNFHTQPVDIQRNYLHLVHYFNAHVSYLKNSKVSNVDYFENEIGKIELELFIKILNKVTLYSVDSEKNIHEN